MPPAFIRVGVVVAIALAAMPEAATRDAAAGSKQTLDGLEWVLDEEAVVERYLGRRALRLNTGSANAVGVSFENGTLEFDLAVGTERNFPIIELRKVGDGEYEEFYFRSHKSAFPDAVQYTPAWQRVGGWQLFHGPGFTARATFPRDEWFPVRIVLSGSKAAVFVGKTAEPQLVVPRLRRGPGAGGLAFEGTFLGTLPAGQYATNISNITLKPGVVPFDFSKVIDTDAPPPGVVGQWQISPRFEPEAGPIRRIPASLLTAPGWKTVEAEGSGLVVLERHIARPPDDVRAVVLARVFVDAPEATTRMFHVGYSDEVTVFLNGQPMFSGDARYSVDNPRQEGLVGLWQGTVYLPLQKGRNELVLSVADVFGGWGLMGQFEDQGLHIRPTEP